MATPDVRNSIVITKEFTYRGATKRWGNRYHFEGALPTDDAAWEAFADLIVNAEKACLDDNCTIVEAVGYDASTATSSNPHGNAVFTKTYTTVGTFSAAGTVPAPGDCAVFVRYGTPARTVRNHPVYLSNYYHSAMISSAGGGDDVTPTQVSAYETYADHWLSGFLCDGSPRERCGPRGAVATSRRVSDQVHHRDFPA
jgi:hypothetical protein